MTGRTDYIRSVAHEAAHCLAARHAGLNVTETVADGHDSYTSYRTTAAPDTVPARLFAAAAGRAGEEGLFGPNIEGARAHHGDYRYSWELAEHATGGDVDGAATLIEQARKAAAEWARTNAPLIAAFARVLAERGRMGEDEIDEVQRELTAGQAAYADHSLRPGPFPAAPDDWIHRGFQVPNSPFPPDVRGVAPMDVAGPWGGYSYDRCGHAQDDYGRPLIVGWRKQPRMLTSARQRTHRPTGNDEEPRR